MVALIPQQGTPETPGYPPGAFEIPFMLDHLAQQKKKNKNQSAPQADILYLTSLESPFTLFILIYFSIPKDIP